MLFVSVCEAGLDGPQVELAVRTFGTDRGMTQKPVAWAVASDTESSTRTEGSF